MLQRCKPQPRWIAGATLTLALVLPLLGSPLAAHAAPAGRPARTRVPAALARSAKPWQEFKFTAGATRAHSVSGIGERQMAVDSNEIAYVSDPDNNQIVVLDLGLVAEGDPSAVKGTVATGAGSKPAGVALNPDESLLYVADSGGPTVTVIDTTTLAVTATVSVPSVAGDTPYSIATASNGKVLLSTTFPSGTGGRIVQIDTPTNTVSTRGDFTTTWSSSQETKLSANVDHSRIGVEVGQGAAGHTFVYDAGTNSFVARNLNAQLDNVSVGPTATVVAADSVTNTYLMDPGLTTQTAVPSAAPDLGSAVAPTGDYMVRVGASNIDYILFSDPQDVLSLPIPADLGTATGTIDFSPDGLFLTFLTTTGIISFPNLPIAVIFDAPASGTTSTTATFQFAALDLVDPRVGATFTCSLDGSAPSPCASPVTLNNLAPRTHTFQVIATDSFGDTTSDQTTWSIVPQGYWMLGANGSVFRFGESPNTGGASLSGGHLATSIAGVPGDRGYWIVDDAGDVFAQAGAGFFGGSPALQAGERITNISATPDGAGYWLFSTLGRVFHFGDAGFFGDESGTRLNGPVLDAVATPDGKGYYMVGSDGGVFAFGDAHFAGSMGSTKLNKPVVGLAPNPTGNGYWLVAADGGIFAFNAPFKGSMGSTPLSQPMIGMVAFGDGYLMVASDGGIFDFSNLPFLGSLGGQNVGTPIVGVAPLV